MSSLTHVDTGRSPALLERSDGSGVAEDLLGLVERREAVIGIVGLGYVGLPLALLFAEKGFRVHGVDTDARRLAMLRAGRSPLAHLGHERVAAAVAGGLELSGAEGLGRCDVVIVCVPTPLGSHREPDLAAVRAASAAVASGLRRGQIVILESTSYPGTTREIVLPALEASGLVAGEDFLLAFSSEREDPGNAQFSTGNIPKVVGGMDGASLRVAAAVYGAVVKEVVLAKSMEIAEASKILENVFRAVNIALVNELKVVFARMCIDVWDVIECAKSKPFGFMPFYPGPGLGGHCIPIDPFYLSWKAAEIGTWARFVELAAEINARMPHYVVDQVIRGVNAAGLSTKGSSALVAGLAYKPDVQDDRESPSYPIIQGLAAAGFEVEYCDPCIPDSGKASQAGAARRSVECSNAAFRAFDVVVICTAHSAFRAPGLFEGVPIVVDTRNVLAEDSKAGMVLKA